jgi:rhodanese-related sulfurtransferase
VGHDGPRREAADASGQQAEPRLGRLLGAGVEQLHPDADPEDRSLLGDELADDLLETALAQPPATTLTLDDAIARGLAHSARLAELEAWRDKPIVVHCHHGVRSLRVAKFLREKGFAHAQSMKGGIDAWSVEVDPAVPRY